MDGWVSRSKGRLERGGEEDRAALEALGKVVRVALEYGDRNGTLELQIGVTSTREVIVRTYGAYGDTSRRIADALAVALGREVSSR